MTNINVLIVEDEPLIAEDIRFFLDSIDYSVAGIAHSSPRALDYLASRNPDAVLLDISIKGPMDGIEIAEIINEKYKIPFIYLTSHADALTVERAKHTLPYGYIVKPFDEKDLLSSIEMAIYRHAQQNKGQFPDLENFNEQTQKNLTQKEHELLCAISEGMTNKQMAEKFFISINTVKYHLKNLFIKLDVPNRSSAIAVLRSIE